MQQAARVSQRTAFFHLVTLVEYGKTTDIFTNPRQERTKEYITGRYSCREHPLLLRVESRRDAVQIVSAWARERVWQYGEVSVVAVSLKNKNTHNKNEIQSIM